MMSKKNYLIYFAFFLFLISCFPIQAESSITNYNVSGSSPNSASFAVQVLKYEPFPANPGEWFDLWVKVQNIGQQNAPNAEFRLLLSYPFSSTDSLVRDYGLVPGTSVAYASLEAGKPVSANEIVMKFRIKVADDAPPGQSAVQLETIPDTNTDFSINYNLPIEIEKTKTDFDVIMQDYTSQGLSFAISNIGDNDANAITFSIEPPQGANFTGARSSIIGNLAKGDFTTITFPLTLNRNIHDVNVTVSYTDIEGIRNTITKTVPVYMNSIANLSAQGRTRTSGSSIFPFLIGLILGGAILFFYNKRKKKS